MRQNLELMSPVKILASLSVLTFVTSLVAIGHGFAPVGFLLGVSLLALVNPNPGADPVWVGVVAFGWLGIITLVASCLLRGLIAWWSAFFGAMVCGIAWVGLVLLSDSGSTFICSAHFMVAGVFLLRHLLLNRPE